MKYLVWFTVLVWATNAQGLTVCNVRELRSNTSDNNVSFTSRNVSTCAAVGQASLCNISCIDQCRGFSPDFAVPGCLADNICVDSAPGATLCTCKNATIIVTPAPTPVNPFLGGSCNCSIPRNCLADDCTACFECCCPPGSVTRSAQNCSGAVNVSQGNGTAPVNQGNVTAPAIALIGDEGVGVMAALMSLTLAFIVVTAYENLREGQPARGAVESLSQVSSRRFTALLSNLGPAMLTSSKLHGLTQDAEKGLKICKKDVTEVTRLCYLTGLTGLRILMEEGQPFDIDLPKLRTEVQGFNKIKTEAEALAAVKRVKSIFSCLRFVVRGNRIEEKKDNDASEEKKDSDANDNERTTVAQEMSFLMILKDQWEKSATELEYFNNIDTYVLRSRQEKIRRWITPLTVFYTLFGTLWLAAFFSFAKQSGSGTIIEGNKLSDFTSAAGIASAISAGGMGNTFLAVPPQYNLSAVAQARTIPIIYGIMHANLLVFCVLPLFFARSFWRLCEYFVPSLPSLLPIEHFRTIHRNFAYLFLSGIALAGVIWMIIMAPLCLKNVENSCAAFDFIGGDILKSVFFLRVVVWIVGFGPMLLIDYSSQVPKLAVIPKRIKHIWFEICYYCHVCGAFAIFILALLSRFEVFYPAIIGWGIYILSTLVDRCLRTYQTEILVGSDCTTTHFYNFDKKVVAVCVNIKNPENARFSMPSFGQWMYVQVPALDYTWHPFSLANEANSLSIELQIGIRGQEDSATKRSWTHQLSDLIDREQDSGQSIPCKIMGPYGSTFEKCLNESYKMSIVIGAGTGLSSALSALRQYIRKKNSHGKVPEKFWFVWSTADALDLYRCWNSLFDLLLHEDSKLSQNEMNNPHSKCMDWLYITIFITRKTTPISDMVDKLRYITLGLDQDKKSGNDLSSEDAPFGPRKALLFKWLTDTKKRIISGKLDGEDYHISKLLRFAQAQVDPSYRSGGKSSARMCITYCGPPALVGILRDAANDVGASCDVSADFV